jgi:hypothetical protein
MRRQISSHVDAETLPIDRRDAALRGSTALSPSSGTSSLLAGRDRFAVNVTSMTAGHFLDRPSP